MRVIESDVVFYRDLAFGSRGDDVTAVQHALKRLGYLAGTADGRWSSGTTAAVKAWQRDLGIPQTGTIQFGELVAAEKLPASLSLSDDLALAKPVAAGDATVSASAGERTFYLALNPEQARAIPADTTIEVFGESSTWPAMITSVEETEDGTTRLVLEHTDGGPVCQDECGELVAAVTVNLRSVQYVVPKVTGPAVPTIAVRRNESGEPYVVREGGARGSGGSGFRQRLHDCGGPSGG